MARLSEQVEWLNLVERSGPLLVPAVLEEVFPQGLEKVETPRRQRLRAAYAEWRDAVDEDDSELDELHAAWTRMVLQDALEYEDGVLIPGERLGAEVIYRAPEHGAEVVPDSAVRGDDGRLRSLMAVYPPGTDLEKPLPRDRWPASPAERMTLLCRANEVRAGLVTNGEQWMLVNAPIGGTSGYASWYARLWWQEPVTLRAFVSLLGVRRCFGPPEERLDQLLERSLAFQEEVTDTLGEQVRRAVEILIQALGRADQGRNGELLKDVRPEELYEAGLTVMMRLVFILCAEERGLLLLGDSVYDQHYAISTLRSRLREDESQCGPEVLEYRYDAWSRILAVFRAVYGGVEHEALRLPALGGSLFNPDRFPFLEGRGNGTSWREEPAVPLPIDNRTVLLLLTALQILEQRGGAQLLSYRALDVEQIGHVYEGLLEYTVVRLPEVTVGLTGTKRARRSSIGLGKLESLRATGTRKTAKHLADLTKRSVPAIKNALERGGDDASLPKLVQACRGDDTLVRRLHPFAELIRTDSWGALLVYPTGSFAITRGAARRETGTHYTPRSLTEAIVEKTLEPVVYTGPAEGKPREEWKLRSPAELLDLKVCDPAMGSGAFLVQVCRYLAERLVEAWAREEDAGRAVTVDGVVRDSMDDHEPLPKSLDDRLLVARRLIAERCLYGVDLNPLAVELAKLSIWLVTLAKERPFGFLDHNLRCGDSLLGIHRLDQLTRLDMDPESGEHQERLFGRSIQVAVDEAMELRKRLRGIPIRDIRDVEEMARLDAESRRVIERPILLADAFVGEVFKSNRKSRALGAALDSLALEVDRYLGGDEDVGEELRQAARKTLAVDLSAGRPARRTLHWPLAFPEVFVADNGGFDAVVGNPPFLSAVSESQARSDDDRAYYQLVWPEFAQGAYDLSLLFWARTTTSLMSSKGRYGLLSPTSMLSKRGDWKTRMHRQFRPDSLHLYPIDFFRSARVRTTAICGGRGQAKSLFIQDLSSPSRHGGRQVTWTDDDNWFAAAGTKVGSKPLDTVALAECATIHAGCTTGDAYELKDEVTDSPMGSGPKLITTGAIDRYISKWGSSKIRYLKDDYATPRWPAESSHRSVSRARMKQVGPKILVAGYTAVIEAWYDMESEAAGVVQTWVVKHPSSNADAPHAKQWLRALCGVLNGATFSRMFVDANGANTMTGNYVVVKKKALLEMPIPRVFKASLDEPMIRCPAKPLVDHTTWSDPANHGAVAGQVSSIVQCLQEEELRSETRAQLDLLCHLMTSSLYFSDDKVWENDLRWWMKRAGVNWSYESCQSLAKRLLPDVIARKAQPQ